MSETTKTLPALFATCVGIVAFLITKNPVGLLMFGGIAAVQYYLRNEPLHGVTQLMFTIAGGACGALVIACHRYACLRGSPPQLAARGPVRLSRVRPRQGLSVRYRLIMYQNVTIKVKKLFPDAKLPVFSTSGAAGADLYAHVRLDDEHLQHDDKGQPFVRIYPGERWVVGAGIAMEVPPGYEAQIRPRSGLAAKYGISIVNTPGTLDSDYRGEVGALLINHGARYFDVHSGDRIAQVVIAPIPKVTFVEADELSDSDRGAGGFGSTGVK